VISQNPLFYWFGNSSEHWKKVRVVTDNYFFEGWDYRIIVRENGNISVVIFGKNPCLTQNFC